MKYIKIYERFICEAAKDIDQSFIVFPNNRPDPASITEHEFYDYCREFEYSVINWDSGFLIAKNAKNDRYYGFYDRYAGDGILLKPHHPGFSTPDETYDNLVDLEDNE